MQKPIDPTLETRILPKNPLAALWQLYEGQRGNLLLGLLFTLIKHLPYLATPIITANIINILTHPGEKSLQELWINAGVFLFLILENVPCHTIANVFLSRALRSLEAGTRGAIVRKMQQLSIGFHDMFQSGRLQSKVLTDVEALCGLSTQLTSGVFMGVVNVVFAVVATVLKQPIVALFYLLTIPLAMILMKLFRSGMRKRTHAYRTQIESMTARISEMIDMIPITRAHGLEEAEISNMTSKLQDVRSAGYRLDVTNALFGSSTWVTMQSFQLFCLVVTGLMAYQGKIPVGDVVLYSGFFQMIIQSINMLLNMYPQIMRGSEAVVSIGEVLSSPDLEANAGKKTPKETKGNFDFENVSYVYPSSGLMAIQDFSLSVKQGECIAFVGESGAGKSTILNTIIGFRRPTRGRLLLDGVDMEELDLRVFRKSIAVVTQQTILFSGTLRDNITYGLQDVPQNRLDEVLAMSNATEFVAKFPEGLNTIIGEGGKTLSGGQMQRIAIARALIRDPQVIILDEATSALDVISEFQVQQAIERLIAGRTTFIVAHRLSTIRIADRIVVMKGGRCMEVGSHDELMALGGEYSRLRKLQS